MDAVGEIAAIVIALVAFALAALGWLSSGMFGAALACACVVYGITDLVFGEVE